ncbi:hypothetical protein [Paenibacillus soyae]|uniref:Uncharacterized protein n=1 Tax=Paenibacillus soyae TaxID=2969249 RepID=A0A9X2MWZ0_9BACL|nr:hypothetical protein [Paenibacillus soyae]MCR2807423.1 hypothetical protein [Paenibacillus soyae]
MGLFGNRWVVMRSESGARADEIDRLYALFKEQGLKAKVEFDGGTVKRVKVHKNDVERAKELIDVFDKER